MRKIVANSINVLLFFTIISFIHAADTAACFFRNDSIAADLAGLPQRICIRELSFYDAGHQSQVTVVGDPIIKGRYYVRNFSNSENVVQYSTEVRVGSKARIFASFATDKTNDRTEVLRIVGETSETSYPDLLHPEIHWTPVEYFFKPLQTSDSET